MIYLIPALILFLIIAALLAMTIASTFPDDRILVVCFILAIPMTFFLAQGWKSYSCEEKWIDFEYKYGLVSGCMIKHDGKWIPAENYRTVP